MWRKHQQYLASFWRSRFLPLILVLYIHILAFWVHWLLLFLKHQLNFLHVECLRFFLKIYYYFLREAQCILDVLFLTAFRLLMDLNVFYHFWRNNIIYDNHMYHKFSFLTIWAFSIHICYLLLNTFLIWKDG